VDLLARCAATAGDGGVVRGGDALGAWLPGAPEPVREGLRRWVQAHPVEVPGDLPDIPGAGLAVPSPSGSWRIVLGEGVAAVLDHVGYRSRLDGPARAVVHHPVALTLTPDGDREVPAPEVVLGRGWALGSGVRAGSSVAGRVAGVLGTAAAEVAATACGCGAHSHPLTLACPRCDRPAERPRRPVRVPGLPVAWVRCDDGRVLPLAGTTLVGRDPWGDPDVAAGRIGGLQMADTERTVSRQHALLRVDGWTVTVQHRGGPNPTVVRPRGAQEVRLLAEDDETPVVPGTALRLGRRWLVLDVVRR